MGHASRSQRGEPPPEEKRPLPHNIDAERSVLGSMMLDAAVIGPVSSIVCDADFYLNAHQVLWRTFAEMREDGLSLDLTAVSDRLRKSGNLDAVGGYVYIAGMVEFVLYSGAAVQNAAIVAEKSALRRIALVGERLAEGARRELPIDSLLDEAETHLAETRPTPTNGVSPVFGCDAGTIYLRKADPVNWVIKDILPEGLTILAAPPKFGKSWIAYQLLLSCCFAGPMFGSREFVAERRKVLYLAREDSDARAQNRMRRLSPDAAPPEGFADVVTLSHPFPTLDKGGLKRLSDWCGANSGAGLVIIDTLNKLRPATTRNEGAYASDYSFTGAIQKVAIQHRCAILAIHHTRKAVSEADDIFEQISGTQGLSGAADCLLVLERKPERRAIMHTRPRDAEERQLTLEFDRGMWTFLGDADNISRTEERQEILDLLTRQGTSTVKEIADAVGKKHANVYKLLCGLEREGLVDRKGKRWDAAVKRPEDGPTALDRRKDLF